MHKYIKGKLIGEGTFGSVWEGWIKNENDEKGERVAMKKLNVGDRRSTEGFRFNDLREVKYLIELDHPNIVKLLDVFIHKQNMWLIFEFCATDLEKVIKYLRQSNRTLSEDDIRTYMKMLLSAVEYCHKNWILHRDLKPGNLLLNDKGELKLADFGLSRSFAGSFSENLTPTVVTRWYRPPELLFGAKNYSYGVDMWSIGCIFAELFLLNPYFPGDNDIDQLSTIFQAMGTPTLKQWPTMKNLPYYIEFTECKGTPFRNVLTAASSDAIDLLEKLLVYDPSKRISAKDALNHPFFKNGDYTPIDKLPLPIESNDEKIVHVTNVRNVRDEIKDSDGMEIVTKLNFDEI